MTDLTIDRQLQALDTLSAHVASGLVNPYAMRASRSCLYEMHTDEGRICCAVGALLSEDAMKVVRDTGTLALVLNVAVDKLDEAGYEIEQICGLPLTTLQQLQGKHDAIQLSCRASEFGEEEARRRMLFYIDEIRQKLQEQKVTDMLLAVEITNG